MRGGKLSLLSTKLPDKPVSGSSISMRIWCDVSLGEETSVTCRRFCLLFFFLK